MQENKINEDKKIEGNNIDNKGLKKDILNISNNINKLIDESNVEIEKLKSLLHEKEENKIISSLMEKNKELLIENEKLQKQIKLLNDANCKHCEEIESKKKEKKEKTKVEKTDKLPNIQLYFVSNNKFKLIDANKELYDMNKCYKFIKFKEKNKNKNISNEDLLKQYLEQIKDEKEKINLRNKE